MAIILAPFMAMVATPTQINAAQAPAALFSGNLFYLMLAGMTIYLCKDSFGGRSLAKRLLKHQVLDSRTNTPATPLQCLLRNFSIVFWPIEIVLVFISPEKRLGDRLAGTKVAPFDKANQPTTFNYLQIPVCLALGFAFLYLIMLPLHAK